MLKELRNKIILFFFPNFFDNFYQSMDYVYIAFKLFLLFIFLLYLYLKRNYFYEYLNQKNILTKSILSNTITRVCLGVLALYNFIRLYNPGSSYLQLELNYFPKGILNVIFKELPDFYIFQAIEILGILFSVLFIFGVFEYFSSFIISIALVLYSSFNESVYDNYWGHGLNLQVVLFIVYFLSGGLNGYSIFKKEFPNNLKSSNFTILVLSSTTSLVFLNAFFWKLKVSGFSWAFSDNLKYLLITQRLYTYSELENYILEISSYPIVYKFLMFGGLMSELLPIFFLFFIKKPILRFLTILPLAFLLLSFEYLLLLGGTLSWLLALITFVDFESLFKKKELPYEVLSKNSKKLMAPLLLFLFIQTAVSFLTPSGFDYKFNTYPISQYPMFAGNYDDDPSTSNKDYFFTNVYFEIDSDFITNEEKQILEKKISYPVNQYFRDFSFSTEKNMILLDRVSEYLISQNIDYKKIEIYFVTQKIPADLKSEEILVLEKNKFAELFKNSFNSYDINIEITNNSPKVIYQNIPPNDINSFELLTISTHSFDKESYSPIELEQLTEHLLNKQREGYKQIVVNLKNGEKLTSGFCYSDFFRDC